MRTTFVALVLATIVAGGANACSATTGGNNNTPTIGKEGGTVTGPDGASINIPAGALESGAAVRILVAADGSYPKPPFTPLGKVYEFLPHGLVFATPVTATLPAPAPAGAFDVWTADPGGAWTKVLTTIATDGKLTFRVAKFSFFAVGPSTAPPGACLGSRLPPARPTTAGSGTTKWFAADAIKLGLTKVGTNIADASAWRDYGYDLDGLCTSKDDSRISANTCKRTSGSATNVLTDGNLGIDNNFGQHTMSVLKSLKADVEEAGNAAIAAGKRTLLLRLENVGPNDNSKVPGALYLAGAMSSGVVPNFDSTDLWPIDTRSLVDGGSVDKPTASFPNGYMAGGVWVSGPIGGGASADVEIPAFDGALRLKLKQAVISVDVASGAMGVIAGAVAVSDLQTEFTKFAKSAGICPGNATYDQIISTMTGSVDLSVGAPNLQDTTRECDAVSVGLGFTMKPTGTPTSAKAPPPPPPDPCTP